MDEGVAAHLYDGRVAVRHDVYVRRIGDELDLGDYGRVAARDLLPVGHSALVFGRQAVPGWRLTFPVAPTADIVYLLPGRQKYGAWIDRFGIAPVAAVLGAVSLALVLIGLKAPEYLAPLVPWSVERSIGNALVGDLDGKFCNAPGGQAALDALVARIDPGGVPTKVRVVNVPVVNAVALPGGTILIFDALLAQARSPDELAGVIGHEMGHVRKRHVMQALLRQAGLGILLGGYGGNMGGTMNALASASYSRAAESAADAYSIDALRRARIDPADTAHFFVKLARDEERLGAAGRALSYVATHPVSTARAKAFAQSGSPAAAYSPGLDAAGWKRLSTICSADPARKKDKPYDFFS